MTLATLKSIASRKLMLAAVAAMGIAPMTAKAHDRIDLAFGHGDVLVNVDLGHDHCAPPPPVVEPVVVEPVTTERVWVDPVYQTVTDRVWVAPVTQDTVQRVWVDATYENRDVVIYTRHGREVVREQVLITPGHWEDQHTQVIVTPGYWENVDRQVLVTPGHYEDRPVAVAVAPPWRR
jgi:hypothetical protein